MLPGLSTLRGSCSKTSWRRTGDMQPRLRPAQVVGTVNHHLIDALCYVESAGCSDQRLCGCLCEGPPSRREVSLCQLALL